MSRIMLQLLLDTVFLYSAHTQSSQRTHYAKLITELKQQAYPDVRPVRNYSKTTRVKLTLALFQLISVDEANQKISTNVWMEEEWPDEYLSWDPADYGGLNTVHLNYHNVWRPDTYLYNSLLIEGSVRLMDASLTSVAENYTKVHIIYPAIFHTSCEMDISNFPFDRQTCRFTFGSAVHTMSEIDYYVTEQSTVVQFCMENQEWDIMHLLKQREEVAFTCCPDNFTLIHFDLIIQRKALSYVINLVVPSLILVIINFLGFFTPTSASGDRSEKITLGITTLLALGVLLLQLADSTPRSSKAIPLIGFYIIVLLVLVGLGSVMTVIVIRLHQNGLRNVPPTPRLDRFIRVFGWVVDHEKAKGFTATRKRSRFSVSQCRRVIIRVANASRLKSQVGIESVLPVNEPETANGGISPPELLTPLDSPTTTREERWLFAAEVLERICLIGFLSSTSAFTMIIFVVGYIRTLIPALPT